MTNQTDDKLVSVDEKSTEQQAVQGVIEQAFTSIMPSTLPSNPSNAANGLHHYCKTELQDFWRFIKRPTRRLRPSSNAGGCWQRLAFFLFLSVLFYIVYMFTIGWAIDALTSITSDLNFSNLKLFAFAALIMAPILEELIFRFGLRNATYTLFFGPILVTIFSGSFFVTLGLTVVIVLMALVFEIQERYRARNGKSGHDFYLGRQFIHAYPKVFWLYAFAFASGHISNHSFDDASWFLVVFAVIPQLVLGVFLGYLRLRDGIASAMSLHFLNNLLAVSLISIFSDS